MRSFCHFAVNLRKSCSTEVIGDSKRNTRENDMSIKRLATLAAGSSAAAAALAALTVAPANAYSPAPGPDPATCVDAWNNGSNSAGQQNLAAVFADGGLGNVIVGSAEGDCVLAAYNTNKPTYVVYRQSGDAFARAGEGPGTQFSQYRATNAPLDVVLQASGKVEPVSQ
jgi:hypothetical protein